MSRKLPAPSALLGGNWTIYPNAHEQPDLSFWDESPTWTEEILNPTLEQITKSFGSKILNIQKSKNEKKEKREKYKKVNSEESCFL